MVTLKEVISNSGVITAEAGGEMPVTVTMHDLVPVPDIVHENPPVMGTPSLLKSVNVISSDIL